MWLCDYVTVIMWLCDYVMIWQCDNVMMLQCDSVSVWWSDALKGVAVCDGVTMWLCDYLNFRRCDSVTVLLCDCVTMCLCETNHVPTLHYTTPILYLIDWYHIEPHPTNYTHTLSTPYYTISSRLAATPDIDYIDLVTGKMT